MNKITIVGGGTAGLASALILRARFPHKQIDIIKSDKIGIIGVGEGSTEHWKEFMEFCNISPFELIKKADATIKLGVMFEGWTEKPYFHSVTSLLHKTRFGQYQAAFGHLINSNVSQLDSSDQFHVHNEMALHSLGPKFYANQFHFNTFKLNELLIEKCKERNITIINDEINDVIVENGKIKELVGKDKNKYQSDFWIDSTGFKRLLITKLGAKWKNYNDYLKLNHAIAFQTEDTDNYNVYTLAKAMKYGWMWRIPVNGRWGNGYIFDDTLIDAKQAKKEVEELLGREVTIGRDIKFEAGAIDKPWVGNCVAVGLSANFIEPLEATSIGTSLNQMFLLIHLIENHKQVDIDIYNDKVKSIMENIRDFVFVHYMVKRKDTEFWKKVTSLEPPETLKKNLEKWKHRLPIKEDFNQTEYYLFFEQNWASVLWGLDLFDKESIKKEYEVFSDDWKNYVIEEVERWKKSYLTPCVPHKDFLKLVRDM